MRLKYDLYERMVMYIEAAVLTLRLVAAASERTAFAAALELEPGTRLLH